MTDRSNPNDPYRGEHPENFPGPDNYGSGSTGGNGYQGGYPGFGQGGQTGGDQPYYGSDPAAGAPGSNSYGTGDNYGAGYPSGAYPGGGYPGGAYPGGNPGGAPQSNNVALWAMIVGIVSIILVITIALFPIGALGGIVAIVLGIFGLRRASQMVGPNSRRSFAITGIVTGVLALLASIALVLMVVAGFRVVEDSGALECVTHLEGDSPDQAAYQECIEDTILGSSSSS